MPDTRDAPLADVLGWATTSGESRDAIYELKKVPARLGLVDAELNLVPATLAHFDKRVAPSPYGPVCRARDVEAARRRGNSRLRALLERYHAAHGTQRQNASVRASYDALIAWVRDREGFTDDGALFPTSKHRCLTTLRARSRVPLDALDQPEVDRLWAEATTEARKSLRRALDLLAALRRGDNAWPEVVPMLPRAALVVPASPNRACRMRWSNLPTAFRSDAEEVLRRTLRTVGDLQAWAREQVAAGRSSLEIDAEVAQLRPARARIPRNHACALSGYRTALTWVARERADRGAGLTTVADLYAIETLEAACVVQIDRAAASVTLKAPGESSTLWCRLTNLTTVARHGLRDPEAVANVRVVRLLHEEYVRGPSEMTADAEAVCDRLRLNPHMGAAFVNGPARLHALATDALSDTGAAQGEDRALRLFAVAAANAIQATRALRPGNLFTIRDRAVEGCPRNLTWVRDRAHAEIRFAGAETKAGRPLTVQVLGKDAEVLWDWHQVHRPRFLELRGLDDTPYLFPGTATPRLRRADLKLPAGCMSPAALVELWDLGDRALGLGLTPHQCRHALATLLLAVHPGNFALVASVLGNTEEVARRHYGKDSGERAAALVREALLARHPDLFKRLRGRTA